MLEWLVLGFVILIVLIVAAASIKIAQEYQRGVVFRLGRYTGIKGPGLFTINPVLESVRTIDIRTRPVDIEPQEAITSDSVTVKVNAVLYYKVTEPMKAVVAVTNFKTAISQAALTTLRNIIGQNELDDLLKERDRINGTLRNIIDELSDPWSRWSRSRLSRSPRACRGPWPARRRPRGRRGRGSSRPRQRSRQPNCSPTPPS